MGPPRSRLRWGLVGGGEGAFFGPVHRMAAALDGRFDLKAGAFSRSPDNNRRTGAALGLDPARAYDDFAHMARSEAARADGVQVVTIATPNHVHFSAAKAFLENGIHVICEKPMTRTLDEAETLKNIVEAQGLVFVLAHTYTCYPMVREARRLVAEGALGTVRVVQVEYAQDWLAADAERIGSKQAAWRVDPESSGEGGSLSDIGTHAYNLVRFVTGLEVKAISADLHSFGADRVLDDNAHVMLRFAGGAKGMLWSSQVAIGRKNALSLRVYGDKGAVEWIQEEPEKLIVSTLGAPSSILVRGDSVPGGRLPAGHPEGFIEALAQLYRETADLIEGGQVQPVASLLPGVSDGVEGLRFIAKAIQSARQDGQWVPLPS